MFQELGFRLLEHLLVSIDLSCMNKILYILFVCTVLPLFSKAQGYTMDLPRLKTFPPYQIDREKRSFVVSWEARDNSVARSVIAYVGVDFRITFGTNVFAHFFNQKSNSPIV